MWGVWVADKRRVRRAIKRLQQVKTWQLVILLILASFLALTFLRLINLGMVQRRSAVETADTANNAEPTVSVLYDLHRYVSAHMNTDMGTGLYLQASYKRAVQAVYTAASSQENPNGNIYEKAQQVCAPQFTRYSTAYLDCTLGQLSKYPAASNLTSALNLPNPYLYRYIYVSPLWSPDFAGWSVLLCIVLALMIVIRLFSLIILRIILNHHYKAL